MSIDKYMFWSMIQGVVNNLKNIDSYREVNWEKNFAFKEGLNNDIKFIDKLLLNNKKLN